MCAHILPPASNSRLANCCQSECFLGRGGERRRGCRGEAGKLGEQRVLRAVCAKMSPEVRPGAGPAHPPEPRRHPFPRPRTPHTPRGGGRADTGAALCSIERPSLCKHSGQILAQEKKTPKRRAVLTQWERTEDLLPEEACRLQTGSLARWSAGAPGVARPDPPPQSQQPGAGAVRVGNF